MNTFGHPIFNIFSNWVNKFNKIYFLFFCRIHCNDFFAGIKFYFMNIFENLINIFLLFLNGVELQLVLQFTTKFLKDHHQTRNKIEQTFLFSSLNNYSALSKQLRDFSKIPLTFQVKIQFDILSKHFTQFQQLKLSSSNFNQLL